MKRNKKGFTLVELVIVIAVIAILAGVMVAVFNGVVRSANESAELQQVKNDELKQKADDVLTKLENANWFSWEDFENSLAAKLTEVYKENSGSNVDVDKIIEGLTAAMTKYFEEKAASNTQLTEEQVKVIIENALANAKLGGVTEQQVRTIVNTAVSGIVTLNKTDVQRIVDAAIAKGLTAADVAQIVAKAGFATTDDVNAINTKINTILEELGKLSKTTLTSDDVKDIIEELLKSSTPTPSGTGISSFAELQAAVANGGTYYLSDDITISGSLTVANSDLTIDLNGKSLIIAEGVTRDSNDCIISSVGTTLVFNDAVGTGKVIYAVEGVHADAVFGTFSDGHLIINGGTFLSATDDLIGGVCTKFTINGGTIVGKLGTIAQSTLNVNCETTLRITNDFLPFSALGNTITTGEGISYTSSDKGAYTEYVFVR